MWSRRTHTAYTDADGFYSFPEVSAGNIVILVKKDGYQVTNPTLTYPDGTSGRAPTVSGDTRYDIELVRR